MNTHSPYSSLPFPALDDSGMPLPEDVRARMEAFFGADLSMVRVHIGAQALAMGCHAFTFGHHIYFAPGKFDPSTFEGMQMLGHELAHVLQQQCGRAVATAPGQAAVLNDRLLEVEADLLGECAARFDGQSGLTMRVDHSGHFHPSWGDGFHVDDFCRFQRWAQDQGMASGVIQRVVTMPKWWSATKAVLVENFVAARVATLPGMLVLYHGAPLAFHGAVTGFNGSEQDWVTAFFQKKLGGTAHCGPGIYGADNLATAQGYDSNIMTATNTELAKSRLVDITGTGLFKKEKVSAQDVRSYAYQCILKYTSNYYAVKDHRVAWA